jgi:uncharacterized protein YdhG (YjbR/CyaY superfamily)
MVCRFLRPCIIKNELNFTVMKTNKFETVKDYFATLPPKQKKLLGELRQIIRGVAPGAEEVVSYNMPAFSQNGILVWYAAYRDHIGLYPKGNAIKKFSEELKDYKTSKGTVQFNIEKKLPVSLIKKIVKYRVAENNEAAALKKQKKTR